MLGRSSLSLLLQNGTMEGFKMKHKGCLYAGHLVALSCIVEIYLIYDLLFNSVNGSVLYLIWFPFWIVGVFRTWWFWLATLIIEGKLKKITFEIGSTPLSGFLSGLLIGLADSLAMVAVGVPMYLLLRFTGRDFSVSSVWSWAYYMLFTVLSLWITMCFIVLYAKKMKHTAIQDS